MPKLFNISVIVSSETKDVVYKYSKYADALEGFEYLLREVLNHNFHPNSIVMKVGDRIRYQYISNPIKNQFI